MRFIGWTRSRELCTCTTTPALLSRTVQHQRPPNGTCLRLRFDWFEARSVLWSVIGQQLTLLPVPTSWQRSHAQPFDQGTQLFLAAVAQGMRLDCALSALGSSAAVIFRMTTRPSFQTVRCSAQWWIGFVASIMSLDARSAVRRVRLTALSSWWTVLSPPSRPRVASGLVGWKTVGALAAAWNRFRTSSLPLDEEGPADHLDPARNRACPGACCVGNRARNAGRRNAGDHARSTRDVKDVSTHAAYSAAKPSVMGEQRGC